MVYDSRHYILTSVMSINYDWFPTGSLSTVRIHFSYRKHVPIVSKWIKGTCKAPYSAFEMLPSSSWTTLIMHSIWTTPSFYIIRKSPSALCLSLSWNIHDCIYSMHFLYHEMLKNLNFHTPYTDVHIWSFGHIIFLHSKPKITCDWFKEWTRSISKTIQFIPHTFNFWLSF